MKPQLQKNLKEIERFGMYYSVVNAPREANTFQKMVVVYLDEFKKRLYQVYLYNEDQDKLWKV